jgi:hypothetical protein
MPRIVLQYPFIRHYAGSVFDLDISFDTVDDYNERFFNRQPAKTTYHLPDDGRGNPVEISISNIFYCLPSVFEGVDLTTGPCRVTSAKTTDLGNNWGENQVVLSEDKQNISITGLFQATRMAIFDRKTNQMLQEKALSTPSRLSRDVPSVYLDFSAFSPGFYEIKIFCKNEIVHTITFIKCFPLVITIEDGTNRHTTMKTIY